MGLIKESFDTHEDVELVSLAKKREQTFNLEEALCHDQAWDDYSRGAKHHPRVGSLGHTPRDSS